MGAQHPPALLVAVSTGQGPCQPGTRPGAQRALRGDKLLRPSPAGGGAGGRRWPLAAGRESVCDVHASEAVCFPCPQRVELKPAGQAP